ncbi:MAG: hypothetical protein ISS01_00430 [Nanoarchaeota archaeon]|nr:hypothetical protein [Nanoarchaeota archaeon]
MKQKIEDNFDKNLEKHGKECFTCNEKTSRPFAILNMDFGEDKKEVYFCSPCCFNEDHIKYAVYILTSHSTRIFANKFKELAELRLEILEKMTK